MKNNSVSQAFTLIEIMFVVAVIGLLLAIAIPSLVKARTLSQTNTCLANLRQLDSAITSWAIERNQSLNAAIDTTAFIGPTNYLREMPKCPGGGEYKFDTVGSIPQVSCTLPGHGLP
jgi:prepilin-type N-terminal cleavage/methylation domain-containing protein